MAQKRLPVRCTFCNQYFLVRKEEAALGKPHACLSCETTAHKSRKMILVEIKEHQHLLNLYHAVYNAAEKPTERHLEQSKRALDDCNRFFSGDPSWL